MAELAGKRIAPRFIKLFGRTHWKDFSRNDWELFVLITAGDANSAFGHVARNTSTLVRQFALIPDELRLIGLLNVVSDLDVPAWRWNQFQDSLHPADGNQLAAFRRLAGIYSASVRIS